MPRWMRKALVVSFTILTFGMVAPPPALTMQDVKTDDTSSVEPVINSSQSFSIETEQFEDYKSKFIRDTVAHAEMLAFTKFGSKISPVIEDEFNDVVLPKIEEVIQLLSYQLPEEELHNLGITEQPTGGMSEKIFHIYSQTTGKDVIRFHVRRDNRPQDGHWFNFHYHTFKDGFQEHHQLADIYWDKNTPPKWLS